LFAAATLATIPCIGGFYFVIVTLQSSPGDSGTHVMYAGLIFWIMVCVCVPVTLTFADPDNRKKAQNPPNVDAPAADDAREPLPDLSIVEQAQQSGWQRIED
jgi:hypothetical protein